MYNDICLIKFKYEVECSPDIRPVCLASDLPKEGDKCRVAGFGDTTGNDNYSSILNEGILSIENHSYCNQVSINSQVVPSGSDSEPTISFTSPMVTVINIKVFAKFPTNPTKVTLETFRYIFKLIIKIDTGAQESRLTLQFSQVM